MTHSYSQTHPEKAKEFYAMTWEKKKVKYRLFRTDSIKYSKEEWVLKDKAETVVSDYAQATRELNDYQLFYSQDYVGLPDEDFAESVAYYVNAKEDMKISSEKKFEFIQNKILVKN